MRLLTSILFSLSACALVLGPVTAEARAKKTARKPAAAVKTAPTASTETPLLYVNADGSVRVPTIADAPADDYQRVAWCHGILSGDMELAEQIASLEPVDERIQTIGRSYLRAYEAALTLSGKGKTEDGHVLAEKARQRGYDGWQGARKADIRKAAYAYDTWQLPGDCEHAATRLSGHPNLFAELATDAEADAIEAALNSGGPHSYAELPKPKLTAQTAPVDADAPIATNTLAKRAAQALPKPAGTPDSGSQPKSEDAPKPQ